jgi:DNA-binding response OmpR family regulator
VLLDLVLPRLNGYEVLTQMRADPALAKVPVIVLSNKGEPEDIRRGLTLGANDYLVKIIASPKEVLWKIRQALYEKQGKPTPMRVLLRENEMDAALLAGTAGKPSNLTCSRCGGKLVLELIPWSDQPGTFAARLICPKCGK